MKKITLQFLIAAFMLISSSSMAQNGFTRRQDVPVHDIANNLLKLAWAGGLNYPRFSEFDYNQDGIKDLFVFDLSDPSIDVGRIICFVNQGTANQVNYVMDPQYFPMFPPAKYWAFTHDYNCDGRYDFYTVSDFFHGIKAYRNDFVSANSFQFTLVSPEIQAHFPSTDTNIPASNPLPPAFSDADNDNDMDIFALDATNPGFIEYYKNISEESLYGCDSLKYNWETFCWGDIMMPTGLNCSQTGISCRTGWFPPDNLPKNNLHKNDYDINYYNQSDAARHDDTRSCICVLDIENDGDKDLLIGGLGDNNVQMDRNGGTPMAAHIDSVDCNWPSYDGTPVQITQFPCSYNLDVDNDGKKDVIVSPSYGNDFDGIWYYKDTSSTSVPRFHYQYNAFLQREMIEVGSGSHPAFFDYDHDGLMDMVIGNYNYFQVGGGCKSGLSLYRNTGTTANPAFQLVTRDYAGLFQATFCTGFCNEVHPTFGDIDGDGDLDMLVGDFCGTLQLFLNNGSNNTSNFGTLGIPSVVNYQGIDVGIASTPQLIDVDRDGKLDLIIGKRNGFITYYHNTGTTTNAVFTWVTDSLGHVDATYGLNGYSSPFMYDSAGTYRLLVGNEAGYLFHYGNIDGNLNGTFAIIDTIMKGVEGVRICLGMGDINGDGIPDLLVGNYAGGVSLFFKDNPLAVIPVSTIEAGPGMEIFPNPANSQTEIQFSNLNPKNKTLLNVFDVTGQKILSLPCSAPSLTLDVSMLSAGIYMLSLEDGKHSVVRKLMVY